MANLKLKFALNVLIYPLIPHSYGSVEGRYIRKKTPYVLTYLHRKMVPELEVVETCTSKGKKRYWLKRNEILKGNNSAKMIRMTPLGEVKNIAQVSDTYVILKRDIKKL